MKKLRILFVCLFLIFLVVYFGSATYIRGQLTEKYFHGVELYENGEYLEAMDIFLDLKGWIGSQEISADDYYLMAKEKLEEQIDTNENEITETIRYATEKENIEHRGEEIEALCKCVWGEARGCSLEQQAAVVWCVLNRVEDERFPNDIISVLEQPGQFDGYNSDYPVDSQIYVLVVDVFNRWSIEQESLGSVGRVLPKEYMWFAGDGVQNYFRDAYSGDYNIWDWSLESPYKED